MSLCRWLLVSATSVLLVSVSFGQNRICKKIPANELVVLDTVAVEPGSVFPESASYSPEEQTVFIDSESDSVEVCYRVLSPVLTEGFANRSISTYDDSRIAVGDPSGGPYVIEKEELFAFDGIRKYGAITRGVSFGNNQSVFVNSTLNLQMDGQVAENLYVSAVITDQNIPYQPEGNTQQLRDFDNVYVKLYNEDFALTAGDIVLDNTVAQDYFLRYHKNVQGLQLDYNHSRNGWSYRTKVSGAASKGKFASTVLETVDGLNGPYRLRGPNGERFIIVLADSEKIFLDGVRLERGFDKDYTIDYNLAEITLNNHLIVTQFSRLRVDFEYSEQFYSRSNISFSQQIEKGRVKVHSGFYRERDNPNSNFGFSLSPDDITQLQQLGDEVDQAFVTGSEPILFDENRILYEQIDTLDLDGRVQRVFKNSANPSSELFAISFSDVGAGNGDYVLLENTSNGRVYEWVSPINGISQGRYQAGSFIPLANSRQLFNTGLEIALNSYETVFSEVALSKTDQNLFSDLDDGNNRGLAYYGGVRSVNRPTFIPGYRLHSSAAVEVDSRNFSFIDRYRAIEFDRNWDLVVDTLSGVNDVILFGEVSMQKDHENNVTYQLNHRQRESVMSGQQHRLLLNERMGAIQVQSTNAVLASDQGSLRSSWFQSKTDLSLRKWALVPGYIFEVDENELKEQDSVISTRMHFQSNEFYLAAGDSSKRTFRASYNIRNDNSPVAGSMEKFLSSKNFKLSYGSHAKMNSILADLNYRKTESSVGLEDEEIIAGRVNWRGNYLRGNLTHSFSFSTGNSRELRREFVYLPVNTGEGTHTWRDLNEDGVQDLNEFFEAINPDERNFVKIFTPTDEYITSFQTFYVHTIDAKTPVSWRRQGGVKSLLSKFSANVNFNINYKTASENYNDRLNPFSIQLDDLDLLASQDQRRLTLFYNRNRRGFAGDVSYRTSDNKQLLAQGFELRRKKDLITNFKVDLSREHTFRLISSFGTIDSESDFMDSRNFLIRSTTYEPQLIWLPTSTLRIVGKFARERQRNELLETSSEASTIKRYGGELTWNKPGKGSLRSSFSWINIQFEGEADSYLAYLLLDALQPGTNQTWQMSWQQRMSKGIQLSLIYNGRKSEEADAIHTGNVQMTAYF